MDNSKRHYLSYLRDLHRPLMLLTGAMIVTTLVALVGLFVDDRLITGAPAWMKPLKFAVSIIFYAVTLAILISLVRKGRRIVRRMGTIAAICGGLEMVAIVGQAVRGRASHFNSATAFDTVVFAFMGTTIVVLWLATAVVTVWLWRAELGERALTWSIRLGLLLSLAGMAEAFLMTRPRSDQLDGGAPTTVGRHSVGVEDGGAGLPLVGWSTTGGDLRVAHFIGLHALQVLPLVALLLIRLARRGGRLGSPLVRTRLVLVTGAGYAALLGLTTWQALRGEPLIHPSTTVVVTAAVLALAFAAGVGWALRSRGDRETDSEPASPRPVAH